ncbi:glycosyltransferase [Variovorax sp. J31P207]|uniref:glycosyltransferase n=1 Tax=Variovorax sp. J31P207 TaxID=3053510 RepID=UPI0025788456|nr:glycosyltransferase [Variovorax sp. J31P207]MDM0067885.1 glycosyltransferase [Variovorax sp. J31P207]
MTGTTSPSRASFTICAWNYFGYAKTLQQSLRQSNPELPFFIFIADRDSPEIPSEQRENVININPGIVSNLDFMAFRYSIMEFNTSVKPHCIEYLFDRLGYELVAYIDPDIFVLGSLDGIFQDLELNADCVLTPHITKPLSDGRLPDDLAIGRAGVYNLGFGAFANRPEAREFLSWWHKWLDTDCVVDLVRGIFVDQRFCDFAPSFIGRTKIERDPGYNLAYWNLPHRRVERQNGMLFANGSPVKFVHFSGVNKDRPLDFSKHQNRYTAETIGELRPLFDFYVERLRVSDVCGDLHFSTIEYGFLRTQNGQFITPLLRSFVTCTSNELESKGLSPFDLTPAYCASPADECAPEHAESVSRLLQHVHARRGDLQEVFDIGSANGRRGLIDWAIGNFSNEYEMAVDWVVPAVIRAQHAEEQRAQEASQNHLVAEIVPAFVPEAAVATDSAQDKVSIGARLQRSLHRLLPARDDAPQPAVIERDAPTSVRRLPGLAIYGFLNSETGVGQAGRALAGAFATTGKPLSTHSFRPPQFKNSVQFATDDGLANHMQHALLAINADNVINLSNYMDPSEVASNSTIGLFYWELPVFPGAWARAADRVDEIWVSSQFVAESLRTTTSKSIRIVPLPVPINDLGIGEARTALELPHDRLIYLVTFDFNSFPQRKNPMAVLRAFVDAFPRASASAPLLIVKCHGMHNRSHFEKEIRQFAALHSHIQIIDRIFSTTEILQLQAATDVFVSLHRSEGFGLNLAEAMAAGKLAVGTAFSGNMDFMDSSNSLLVDYKMKALSEGDYVFWNGQWWADPIHDHAVAALEQAEDSSLRSRLGAAARVQVADLLSVSRVGAVMSTHLN